ncbi:MAG: response regulator [Corallococcus sp.]|nr:response regulator [Corallococcus sp.]
MANDFEKGKILIVDDSEMNRSILSDILADEYEIIEASDGLEAMDLLGKYKDSISLVLLDIVMPRMDGFSVLSKMNENNWIQSIPVIIISSENASLYVERAYELGALDYIQRPFDTVVVRRRSLNTIMLYGRQKISAGASKDQLSHNSQDLMSVINILTNLIDYGNIDIGHHVENVSAICEILLNNLGGISFKYKLSPADIQTISIASTLHDLGMYLIDGNNADCDTDKAMEEMRKHTLLGAEMLEKLSDGNDSQLIRRAIEICKYHHERWDGKGYPEGLKGDQTPVSAQAVAIADTYDKLTNKKLNRDAITHAEAIEKILNGECGAFNPVLMIVLKSVADTLPAKLK